MNTANTHSGTRAQGDAGTRGRAALAGLVLAVLLVLGTTALWAQPAHGPEHGVPPLSTLLFPMVNFVIFLYILRRAGGEIVREYLTKRRADVVAALDAAGDAKTTAEKTRDEIRARLERADEETGRLAGDIRAAAEWEHERRTKLATETAARIARDAGLIAAQEVRKATAALRDETVAAAVKETLALLRRQVKPTDQNRFLDEFVDSMRVQP